MRWDNSKVFSIFKKFVNLKKFVDLNCRVELWVEMRWDEITQKFSLSWKKFVILKKFVDSINWVEWDNSKKFPTQFFSRY